MANKYCGDLGVVPDRNLIRRPMGCGHAFLHGKTTGPLKSIPTPASSISPGGRKSNTAKWKTNSLAAGIGGWGGEVVCLLGINIEQMDR